MFASEDLPEGTNIGRYEGHLLRETSKSRDKYPKNYLLHVCDDYYIDPSFHNEVLPQFQTSVGCRVNEPSPELRQYVNCMYVVVYPNATNGLTHPIIEIRTVGPIKEGEELCVFYGTDFLRDYEIDLPEI